MASLVAVLAMLVFGVLVLVVLSKRPRQSLPPKESSDARRMWAIAEWRRLGGDVFRQHVGVEDEVWALWNRLRMLGEENAALRVCTWCGKTNVPGHVFGVVNTKGGTNAWYCSNACYRGGNSYEDLP